MQTGSCQSFTLFSLSPSSFPIYPCYFLEDVNRLLHRRHIYLKVIASLGSSPFISCAFNLQTSPRISALLATSYLNPPCTPCSTQIRLYPQPRHTAVNNLVSMAAKHCGSDPLLTFVYSVSMGTLCPFCSKTFGTRKKYTDHRRTKHGLYRIHDSCMSRFSFCPPVSTQPHTASMNLLTSGAPGVNLRCNVCNDEFSGTPKTIKAHYKRKHRLAVRVSTMIPDLPRSQQTASSSSLPEDVNMEDVDFSGDETASLDMGARGDFLDPQSDDGGDGGNDDDDDDDGEWDMESVVSDAPTEVLLEEDEDDIVPSSFNLSTSADTPPHDDHLELDNELTEESPESEEGPPSPVGVYRSDSELSRLLCLRYFVT